MMREIKFRGKRVDGKAWVYGSLQIWADGEYSILDDEDGYIVVPETVGQYTGLKANGVEIYEGDIATERHKGSCGCGKTKYTGETLEIAFDSGMFAFGYHHVELTHYINNTGLEVIGNRFDNPELLEEK